MRHKEIKVTIQRRPPFDIETGGIASVCPEAYIVKRISNSLFVSTEIGKDNKRRGSMHDPELKFYVGDFLTPRQAEDIANCYEATVIAAESE